MTVIKFGTDGWRGIIARDFTFDNVRACAQGVANYLHKTGAAPRGLVVGYDTRFASEDFASEVAQVVAANGIKTYLADQRAPTPAISYTIVHRQCGGGVVITASHNPGRWNGFKFRTEYGSSAPPEVVADLEGEIAQALASGEIHTMPLQEASNRGLLEEIDPAAPYLTHLLHLVDVEALRGNQVKLVVDAMYGAGAGYLPRILGEGAISVTELHGERNPSFPGMVQPEPIASNLRALAQEVPELGADVGLAIDGDGDRLGVMDEEGRFITTLQTFSLLCLYLLEVQGMKGPLVRSITMSSMIDRLGEAYGVPVFDAPVGFKYLGPVMMRENALAAGEESGGYAFRGHTPERDGILSGLMFLDLMAKTGKRPSELVEWLYSKVGPHYFDRRDISFEASQRGKIQERMSRARPTKLAGFSVKSIDTRDGYQYQIEGGYWALVRLSGTEPLVRIYAEAESPQRATDLLTAVGEVLEL